MTHLPRCWTKRMQSELLPTRMRMLWLMVGLVLVAANREGFAAEAPVRPNILFLFADDQAQTALGAAGNPHIHTPHLDQLAQRGIMFDNAFVTTAICCTNRASILTGQHMFRHRIPDFKTPLTEAAFDQTYPALLRQAGYRTGFMGKYAIGNPAFADETLCLPAHKFDDWYGFPQSIDFKQTVNGEVRYLTEVMTERAIEFFKATPAGQPFCLTIAFKEPHGPFNYFDPAVPNDYETAQLPVPPSFTQADFDALPEFLRASLNADGLGGVKLSLDRLQNELRTHYRTVSRLDMAVGQMVAALKEMGLDQNTVIIFSSDHGSLLGHHGLSGKWLMYEQSIRVPLIIYDPRLPANMAGGHRQEMVLSIDLAPTMLALGGVTVPAQMQGQSLLPVVSQQATGWRDHYYYQHTYNTDPPRAPIPVTEGIRTTGWKYIRYPEQQPVYEQLFDLTADPLERTNLVGEAKHAAVLSKLRTMCDNGQSDQ